MTISNDQEFELAKMDLLNQRFGLAAECFKTLIWIACILGLTYMMFDALKSMVIANPAGISAIALVVKNLGLGTKLSYLVSAATGSAWYIERKGRKRLLTQLSDARQLKESKDPYKNGSGLTSSGDTPDKKKRK